MAMKKGIFGAVVLAAVGTLLGSNATQAATTRVDLSTTGSIFAGLTGAQTGQEIVFSFTVKNHSTNKSADLEVTFTTTNGTADGADYICPLIRNHFNINPDTPSCEPGALPANKSETVGILVTPETAGTMTVRACASNESNAPDPVPSNNCKTLSLAIS